VAKESYLMNIRVCRLTAPELPLSVNNKRQVKSPRDYMTWLRKGFEVVSLSFSRNWECSKSVAFKLISPVPPDVISFQLYTPKVVGV
jgi:hypothetical protein